MTRARLNAALDELQAELLQMGGMVEAAIAGSVDSLARQDLSLAQLIIDGDDQIDALNLKIEEDCIYLIALQQPLAKDLREITSILKIVTDLERIADHASNIAKITLRIGNEPLIRPLVDLPKMAELAQQMVRNSLRSLVERDRELAKENCLQDDQVDQLYLLIFNEVTEYILARPEDRKVVQALNLLFVARYLERVGDHATNIGERVIYLVSGRNERY